MNLRLYFFIRTTFVVFSLLFSATIFAQTADVVKGCSPLAVNFTAPAGSVGWFWDFKDGGSSNIQNPSNIFTTPGSYQVEFRNTPNGPVVGTVLITVWAKPDIALAATPTTGCAPLLVQFQDNSTFNPDIQILNRSWVFGDGGSAGNLINPTHTYVVGANFTVSLELTTNYPSCNITEVFPSLVKTSIPPVVSFITFPNPPQSCTVPFDLTVANTTVGTGVLTYAWNYGNGNTSTLQNPPVQTYTQLGVFPLTLTVTDALGCSGTAQATVNVGNPGANFSAPDTICIGEKITLQNQSPPGSFVWSFGPNGVPATSSQPNPMVKFNSPGNQTISLTVTTTTGCTGTVTKTIYVDQADANFTLNPAYSCNEPVIFNVGSTSSVANEWAWLFPDSSFASTKLSSYTWTNPDTTGYHSLGQFLDSIRLIVENPSGCRDTFKRAVEVWLPNARFVPNVQHGCAPLMVAFADSSFSNEPITQWTWIFDDGTPNVVQTSGGGVAHTFTQPGEYDVQLIIRNSAGCIDTSYKFTIEVGVPITGDFTASPLAICPGGSVQFTNLTNDPRIDAWHFYSDNDQSWHCYQNQNPSWTHNSQAGPLDVSLMLEYNGCFNTVTKADYITLKGPIARLHYKTTCDNTLLFDFQDESTGATSIKWTLGDGDSSVLSQFTHLYDTAGTYTVILTAVNDTSGCPASVDSTKVYATQLKSEFELPFYICAGKEYQLDGGDATGVNASCYKGYTWYFTFQRPIRTDMATIPFMFTDNGPHTVWLEVQDINGCLDTIGQDVRVYQQYPKFEMSDSLICLPGTVQFSDMSTADTTLQKWVWDFGDNTPAVSGLQPSHTYTTPPPGGLDFYIVTLIITDTLGCSNVITRNIRYYKPTSIIFATPESNICEGDTPTLIATQYTGGGSSLSWSWNFGDGSPTATGQVVTHTYLQDGTYTVTMNFTENGSGCTDFRTTQINVQKPPEASFSTNVDSIDIICYPQNIQLLNTSTSNYPLSIIWDLGNGQTPVGNTAATVFPKGTFTVQMVAITPFGCPDTTWRSFTVVGPEGNFEMDKNFICKGDEITFNLKDTLDISSFSWSFGDGTTADNVNPITHSYDFLPPSGATVAKLILRGEDDACAFTVSLPVNFSLVDANFSALQDPLCLGLEHAFVNASLEDDIWAWSFGDNTSSNLENPTHEYDTEGTYTVSLIVTDTPLGCTDTLVQSVTVSGLPNFEAIGDFICAGDTAKIGLLGPVQGATYTWTPSNTVLNPKDKFSVSVNPTETTIYTVSVVVDSTGCMDSDTALVFVPGLYDGAQNLDTLVEKGQPVTLPFVTNPLYTFTWMPDVPNGTPPVVTPQDTSLHYILTVKDQFGCYESKFDYFIRVFPQNIKTPNIFSPQNDGDNDVFQLIPDGEPGFITVNYLRIFNRWGQKVFEGSGTDATVAWNGLHDGKLAPVDVYVWQASVTYVTGRSETLTGELTLIR